MIRIECYGPLPDLPDELEPLEIEKIVNVKEHLKPFFKDAAAVDGMDMKNLIFIVNDRTADNETIVRDGDTVRIFFPVLGG